MMCNNHKEENVPLLEDFSSFQKKKTKKQYKSISKYAVAIRNFYDHKWVYFIAWRHLEEISAEGHSWEILGR